LPKASPDKVGQLRFRGCIDFALTAHRRGSAAKQLSDRSGRLMRRNASGNHLALPERQCPALSDAAGQDESHYAMPPGNRSTMTAYQKLVRSPLATLRASSDPILRFLCRSKPSMKSVTHQSTLHLSFKIKCCVDRLRPPGKSRHRRFAA
jgi:hypothetical protein